MLMLVHCIDGLVNGSFVRNSYHLGSKYKDSGKEVYLWKCVSLQTKFKVVVTGLDLFKKS